MPGYQEVSFPSRDAHQPRLTLRAWWVPAEKVGAPAVIVVHGIHSCRHDPVVLLPAGMLARNGFSVLMMDMRDEGDSDIEDGRSGWGSEEYLDILGAWDWLQSAQGLPASRIGLMGESLGGSSAIIAMGEEQAIAATWADSAFADPGVLFDEVAVGNGLPTWLRPGVIAWAKIIANDDLLARRPVDEVEKIGTRPLAIVHGLADDLDVHHADDLAAAHATFVPGYEPWLVPRPGASRLSTALRVAPIVTPITMCGGAGKCRMPICSWSWPRSPACSSASGPSLRSGAAGRPTSWTWGRLATSCSSRSTSWRWPSPRSS
jgi:fermentation-respiration switch protein FrsA (DUF1100 family)